MRAKWGVIAVTGLAMASQLGRGVATHRRRILAGEREAVVPWGELPEVELPEVELALAEAGKWEALAQVGVRPLAAALREKLGAGLLAPASKLALMMARDALADAGRRQDELQHCGLFVASSRGNLAGWADAWPGRRARGLVAASNSAHVELAGGVQRELALEGPVHVSADGCAAGLSALALANLALQAGEVERALVVAVDLPLGAAVMQAYASSGILGSGSNAPWSELANGMVPAEGGAAVLLERVSEAEGRYFPSLEKTLVRHEGFHLLHSDPEAQRLRAWLGSLSEGLEEGGLLLCPHASGTASNRVTELRALESLGAGAGKLFCPRPWLGHSIGATGLLDWVLGLQAWRQGESWQLPAGFGGGDALALEVEDAVAGQSLLNWSLGMGGQFAACLAKAPELPARRGVRARFSVQEKRLVVEDRLGKELLSVPCSSAARGVGFEEGSFQTPLGRFEIREKYGYASSARTTFVGRQPQAPWGDEEAEGTKVTRGILRLHGLDEANANTWERFVYVHGTNQLSYPPENLSHGCLTLEEEDFERAFRLLPEGGLLEVVF